MDISIHAPARGATPAETPVQTRRNISIHAPARGATKALDALLEMETISIHAPARGATKMSLAPTILFAHFNPRSREGSD